MLLFSLVLMFFINNFYVNSKSGDDNNKLNNPLLQDNYLKLPEPKVNAKFSDLIGIEEYIEDLKVLVKLLNPKTSEKITFLNKPKGALLYGPPGVGKTAIARAIAGEAEVNFYYFCGSELVNKYVGMGAKVLRETFKHAKTNGPSVVFIDEIDALSSRDTEFGQSDNTMTQLLTLLDGFEPNDNVVIIIATNDIDSVDRALLRSGRIDIKIEIPLPFESARKKLLEYYTKLIRCELKDSDITDYSKKTFGFSPADIKNMTNIAIINAIKNGKTMADHNDFNIALDKIKLGVLDKKHVNKSSSKVDYFSLIEAAKAVYLFENTTLKEETEKISLLHNNFSKNKSFISKKEEKYNYTKTQLLDKIKYYYCGTAVEEMLNKEPSNFSLTDFQKGKSLLHDYITKFAMVEDFNFINIDVYEVSNKYKILIDSKVEELS